ncbi:MAG: hypothetical protein ACFFDT_32895, partial [Candidatus Hodarchaeota archaeon]
MLEISKQWIKILLSVLLASILLFSSNILVPAKRNTYSPEQTTITSSPWPEGSTLTSEIGGNGAGEGTVGFKEGDKFTLLTVANLKMKNANGDTMSALEYTFTQTIEIISINKAFRKVEIISWYASEVEYDYTIIYGKDNPVLMELFYYHEYYIGDYPIFHFTDEFDNWEGDMNDVLESFVNDEEYEVLSHGVTGGKASLKYETTGSANYIEGE